MPAPRWVTGSLQRANGSELNDRTNFVEQFNTAIDTIRIGLPQCNEFLDNPNNFADAKFRLGRRDLSTYIYQMIYVFDSHANDFLSDWKILPKFHEIGINTDFDVEFQKAPEDNYIYAMVNRHYDFAGRVALTTSIYKTKDGYVLEIEDDDSNHYILLFQNGNVDIKSARRIQIEGSVSSIDQFKTASACVSRNIFTISDEINSKRTFQASKILLGREDLTGDLSSIFQIINLNKDKLGTEEREIIIQTVKKITGLDIEMRVNGSEFHPPTAQITIFDKTGKAVYLVTPYIDRDKVILEIESYIDADTKVFEFPKD